MRLVHISDLHFGALNPVLPEALLKSIELHEPDLVVISGDLSQKGKPAEFKAARAFLDALTAPYFVVPGNHDMPHGLDLWGRFRRTWKHFLSEMGIDLESVWKNEEAVIYGANSAKPAGWYIDWSRGNLSTKQLEQIKDVFDQVDDSLLKVLVVHHPPGAPAGGIKRHLIDKRSAMIQTLATARIDLVLSGHFHVSYALPVPLSDVPRAACVLSVVSTATSHRLQGEPNGFHLIEGNAQNLRVEPYAWDGVSFNPGTSWHFRKKAPSVWELVNG